MADGDDGVGGAGRDAAGAEPGAVVGQVAGEGLAVGGEGEVLRAASEWCQAGGMSGRWRAVVTTYDLRFVKPTASPMMSARPASVTPNRTQRNVLRLRPRYRLCGGRTASSPATKLTFAL